MNTLCPQGFLPMVTKDQVSFSPETSRPLAPILPHPSQGLCSSNYSFSSAPSILLPLSECDPVLPIWKSRKEKHKTKLPLPHLFTQPLPYFSAVLHREISRRLLTVSASTSSSPFLPSAPSAGCLLHWASSCGINTHALPWSYPSCHTECTAPSS